MEQWPLPNGWEWKTLAEVNVINPRRPTLQRDDDAPTSFVPMAGVDEIEGKFADVQIRPYREVKRGFTYFEENDVVLAKITPSMENGKMAIARGLIDGFGFGTTEFHVFRPKTGILSEWIHRYIRRQEFRQGAKEHFRGAVGQQRVPQDFLESCPIPIPYPDDLTASLEIQQRIIARLDALLGEVGEARKLQTSIEEDTQSLMQAARREVFGTDERADWIPLSTYVQRIENGWSPVCESRPATDEEWGVVKVGSVTFGVFNPGENKALPSKLKPRPQYEIHVGDFLMSRANTRELAGACAVVEQTRPRLMLSDKIFRFIFRDDALLDRHYLDQVLKSPVLRAQIEQGATGSSASMKNISKEKVMRLMIPPHDFEQQRSIAAYLKRLQLATFEMESVLREDRDKIDMLEQTLLSQAFRGEL